MAFGAMREIQSRGLSVGDDISVIGFDDIALARYSHPALTTIQQPVQEIGRLMFQLLQAVIQERPTEALSGRLIQPTLQIRQTTQPKR